MGRYLKEDLNYMEHNEVCNLIDFPSDSKKVRYKGVFKTKCDANGNIERHKIRIVAKCFTKNDGIDYKKALVSYYNLELYPMDVKNDFLNGDFWRMMFTRINLKDFPLRERNTWYVNLRNQYTDSNRLSIIGTLSLMIPLLFLALKKT